MNILASLQIPTSGIARLLGQNLYSGYSPKKVLIEVGFCPQFDALWEPITTEEHMRLYGAIKGVPPDILKERIDILGDLMQFSQHFKKKSKALSGGTKRKLSFSIAIIGNPSIWLLDEPSTGLDPNGKRYLWSVIYSVGLHSAKVLTTTSLDEAELLCNRMAILVNGRFQCIGSSQHLKQKFGIGYELTVKINDINQENLLISFVTQKWRSKLLESFNGMYKFQLHTKNPLSEIFREMKELTKEISIDTYAVSQTTLETVFLRFAKRQRLDSS